MPGLSGSSVCPLQWTKKFSGAFWVSTFQHVFYFLIKKPPCYATYGTNLPNWHKGRFGFPVCILLLDQKIMGKIYGRKLLFENKHLLLLIHGDNFLKNKYIFRIWIRPWLFNPLDYLETFTRWFPRGRIYKRDGLSLLGIRFLTRSDIVIECGWLVLPPAIKFYFIPRF
jgi:hypothetical protein